MKCSHDIVIPIQVILLLIAKLDLASTVFRQQYGVPFFYGHRSKLTVLKVLARAYCNYHSEIQLFTLFLREQDSAFGFCEGIGFFDEDTV